MSNPSPRKILVLAVSVGLLIAALSGGAVTYASFTDSGSVDVTFTAGNITSSSDDVSGTESTGDDNQTSLNDSDTTDNQTSLNDSDTTDNQTSQNDSKQLSGVLPATGVPTTSGSNVGQRSVGVPAVAVPSVDHPRLPRAPPPGDR